MNSENNNLNGVVLGSVNNATNANNNTNNTIDSLNTLSSVNKEVINQVVPNPVNNGLNEVDNLSKQNTTSTVNTPNNVLINENLNTNKEVVGSTVTSVNTPSEVINPSVVMPTENINTTTNTKAVNPINNSVNISQGESKVNEPVAYTSVNDISIPTPNFENNIGTNPPISLEKDKVKKKKPNYTLFVIIILILLSFVAFGTYYVLNYTNLLVKKQKINISVNNVTLSVGDLLPSDINYYAKVDGTNISNCTINTKSIDVYTEGTYNFTVKCSDIEKTGTVKVINDKELVIATKTVYKTKNESIDVKEFIVNEESNVTYTFVEESSVNDILNSDLGDYTVKIKGTRTDGKTTEVNAKLVLIEHKIKGYTICKVDDSSYTEAETNKAVKLAIVEDGNNGFGNIGYEIYTFKYANDGDYINLVNEYNKNNTLTINNVSGIVELNNNDKIITITKELTSDEINNFGTDNLKNFGSIMTYFQNTLNYKCSYEKAS